MLHNLRFALTKVLLYTVGYLPLPLLHLLGSLLGLLIYFLPLRMRYYASTNIKLCFPKLTFLRQQMLLLRSLKEIGKGVFEAPVFWVRQQSHLLKLVRNKSALLAVLAAKSSSHGAIILGMHLGGFYLNNAIIANTLPGITYLYRAQKGMLGKIMDQLRNRFGANLVTTSNSGVFSLFRHLKQGGVVGMLCDHNAGGYGNVFAPFFDILVPTMTLPLRLAMKTKVPVFMAVMQRLSWARGYRLHVWQLSDAIYTEDLERAATAMNAEVEKAVRLFPTQHEWLYRRFWDRPKGQAPFYKTQLK